MTSNVYAAIEQDVRRAPSCYLLDGDHWPAEITVCLEAWLTALDDGEVRR